MDRLKGVWRAYRSWWGSLPDKVVSSVLDWLIVGAALILIAVIYIPKGIWAEEDTATELSRQRMTVIQQSQDFFHTIVGEYALDGQFLFDLISQAHDTLIGDTTFIGKQSIIIDGIRHLVNIPEGMGWRMDTTYSVGRPVRREVLDTTYTIVLFDAELAANDTIYLIGATALSTIFDDPGYRGVPDTSYGRHTEVITDYTWNRFRLSADLLLSPVTGEPFHMALDSSLSEFTITDPLSFDYSERRYFFFSFKPPNAGKIVAGDPSWKGN